MPNVGQDLLHADSLQTRDQQSRRRRRYQYHCGTGRGGKKSISPRKFPNMGRALFLLLYPLDINFLQSGGVLHYQSHTRWWCDGSSVLQRIGLMSATTPFFLFFVFFFLSFFIVAGHQFFPTDLVSKATHSCANRLLNDF